MRVKRTFSKDAFKRIETTLTGKIAYRFNETEADGVVTCDEEIMDNDVDKLKALVTELINENDSEEGAGNVNNFYFEYGGQKFPYWFNAYERTALTSEATQWAKKYGTYRIDARKYGVSFEISCDTLLDWLGQLKDYAIKCYNKTTDHLLAVSALTTVEEVAAYDYKAGYPENLVFKVD